MLLTKSDFLQYRQAPLHLWAGLHNRLEKTTLDDFTRHLMMQGQEVEALAQVFLPDYLAARYPGAAIHSQAVAIDGNYYARVDVLVEGPAGGWDVYEIKSSTSIKEEHLEDVTFQALAVAANRPVRDVYILHVNNEYDRHGDLDLDAFFKVVNVSQEVADRRQEVESAREAAWLAAQQPKPDGLTGCSKPGECPCPGLCFPGLPESSIFHLPRLGKKTRQLQDRGILALADFPMDVKLSPLQQKHLDAALSKETFVDSKAIQAELESLVFPLYFLDYETFNPAVPLFDGYSPYQHMVFQYSLHVLDEPGGLLRHHEFLAVEAGDPEPPLLNSLAAALGQGGTVVVWNKRFEMERNLEMSARLPEYRDFLMDVNARVYDLMEIFSKGLYVDGGFHGSASIKHVLPALAPSFNYNNLPIGKGDQAMLAWWAMVSGEMDAEQRSQTARDLLTYCCLDTLAMVKIWEFLRTLSR